MASDYKKICKENQQRYGTDIGRIGPMLLVDRYDDRTHFIFELLQNAEDALSRRANWTGSRRVQFTLTDSRLTLSHFGRPFDEADVRGICGIAESTKDEFSIGRFGIGFKSVYTFTDRPEIHSGDEDFVVENYVQPHPAKPTARNQDETTIALPLKQEDQTAQKEITRGFRQLGPSALLFLQQINEISWSIEGGPSGFYVRNTAESLGPNVQRVCVLGQETGHPEVDQNWLVFGRDVFSPTQKKVGSVELAFSISESSSESDQWTAQPVTNSPLVVFFPTVVSTNLGFLVQGPYRTTPSRDNIPRGDQWNHYLVNETASLLVEAMRWMRDNKMLDVSALRCLPLSRELFPEGSMFAPLFETVLHAFLEEPLLPSFDGNYVTAVQAKLARTQELRELFSGEQVAALFETETSAWLSADITQDRAPEIRQYLMRELEVSEITPATLVTRLTRSFLEAQSDNWVLRLYEYLSGQEGALRRRLDSIPLIRLEDGTHTTVRENGKIRVFLPSEFETAFPTIRRAVCSTAEVRSFLSSLGITEPDPVDDVIWNVLPKYRRDQIEVDDDTYAADIERILSASKTDSSTQRGKLRSALRETSFIMVVDAGDGKDYIAKPGDTYLATDRLKQLFSGVPGVLIVDGEYDCLRGEEIRELLVACGASRYLTPSQIPSSLKAAEKTEIRKEAGLERASWQDAPEDFTLRGLGQLLECLPKLEPGEAKLRAELLWESLIDLETRGTGAFYGNYRWGYSHETKTTRFDAAFVETLRQVSWVPDTNGELVCPSLVVFDSLGWKPNPFLISKLAFKPPIIDQLAREVGIDPDALDLLRKYGITSATDLASRLGFTPLPPESPTGPEREPGIEDEKPGGDVYSEAQDLYGEDMPEIPPGTFDSEGGDSVGGNGIERTYTGGHSGSNSERSGSGRPYYPTGGEQVGNSRGTQGSRPPGSYGGRPFISYVGASPNHQESDADGLDQAVRMQIEAKAIEFITRQEPSLLRTSEGTPGFDLYEANSHGQQIRWIEVKAMTGCMADRPVGLSRTQFDFAREKGEAYWLYVVEYANDPARVRLLRIQNPAGQTQTFTFDRGWSEIAEEGPPA